MRPYFGTVVQLPESTDVRDTHNDRGTIGIFLPEATASGAGSLAARTLRGAFRGYPWDENARGLDK